MNNYHIHEIIGRGRQSKVYKARLKQSLEYVVVKACSKDLKARVLQEVKVLNSLAHPNLLRFHTWYETQNHLWVILEYCVGGDLQALLRSDGHLPEAAVLRLGRDLSAALQHLHSRGVLHCDLKPSNVLLDENGHVRLGGLGISRRFEVVERQLATLPNGLREMQQGSPYYLAPETVRTPGFYTTASDLWTLGCMLFECATGRPPFAAQTTAALQAAILGQAPALPPSSSPELADLIQRLLEKDPLRRCTWGELCGHPFWGASPPQLQPLPDEPVLRQLEEERGGAAAERHRASSSGSSLGGDAEFAANGVTAAGLREAASLAGVCGGGGGGGGAPAGSAGTSGGGAEYLRGGGGGAAGADAGGLQSAGSGDYSASAAAGQRAAASAAAATAATAAAAASQQQPAGSPGDPGQTPAHPRAQSRTAGMAGRPGPGPAEALAAAAADGAAGVAPQFAAHGAPQAGGGAHGARGSGGGSGGVAAAAAAAAAAGLEALVYHPTDSVMKPIVGNKRIERPLENHLNPSLLPFQPLAASKVAALPPQAKAAFVAQLARTVSGAAHPHTKLATLVYSESLCGDVAAVQEMVNGSMAPALVALLDPGGRDPTLRLRAANLLGLLVRHASSVDARLADAGACEALAEAVAQHEDVALQRRAAAALGELLFYADSQHRDSGGGGGGGAAWDLPPGAVHRLAGLLQAGQDEVAQHYAAKALENVFGLGGPWAQQLATGETMGRLMQLVDSRLPDVLRGTAASALCRLLRCQPACLAGFADAGGLDLVAAGLADGSPRVQQACVTVLAQLLCARQLGAQVAELCLGCDAVLEGLNALLDNAAEMLQAKALVALGLLCRSPAGLVAVVSWRGLLPQIERLCFKERQGSTAGSSEQYMAAAVAGFLQQLAGNVVPLLRQAAASGRASGGGRGHGPGSSGSDGGGSGTSSGSSSGGALAPLEALQALLGSAAFRQVVVCDGLITGLADLLTREVSSASAASPPHQELKAAVLTAVDAVCSHPELLVERHAPVLAHLLPALSAAVASGRETPDTRFVCLKLLCDVVLQFVNEPRLYISETELEHTPADSGIANAQIDAAVAQYVLPLMPALLADEDPMPLYALKLLGALLEFNRRWVADVAAVGLAGSFFEWLSISHPHNNVHNMRLCRLVADARVLPAATLEQLGAVDRVLAVLAYAHENDVEPFLEPALRLCSSLLGDVGAAESRKFIAALPLLLELSCSPDGDTALAAAHCLLKAAHLHPGEAAAVLAAGDSVELLLELLDPAGSGAPARLAAHLPGGGGGEGSPTASASASAAAFHADLAPLLLLVLAAVAEARPGLLDEGGPRLRPAIAASLDAVGDPGLKRRWSRLLAAQP